MRRAERWSISFCLTFGIAVGALPFIFTEVGWLLAAALFGVGHVTAGVSLVLLFAHRRAKG